MGGKSRTDVSIKPSLLKISVRNIDYGVAIDLSFQKLTIEFFDKKGEGKEE